MVVYGTPDESNGDRLSRIATDATQDAIAMEVNDVDSDLRRFSCDARAGVNDDRLSGEVQAVDVINDVPVPTFRSFRTASGIHDATKAEVRCFALPKGAAARHPAWSG